MEGSSGWTWIVDPLDGSRNFASENPHFAVNLGLAYEGEMELAFTYDPLRKEMFHGRRGGGAFLNDKPIRVSQQETIAASVLSTDMGYDEEMARRAVLMLMGHVAGDADDTDHGVGGAGAGVGGVRSGGHVLSPCAGAVGRDVRPAAGAGGGRGGDDGVGWAGGLLHTERHSDQRRDSCGVHGED